MNHKELKEPIEEMKSVVQEVSGGMPDVIERIRRDVPAGFPVRMADSILKGIGAGAGQLEEEWAAVRSGCGPLVTAGSGRDLRSSILSPCRVGDPLSLLQIGKRDAH
jgi:hypothetical protein